MGLPVGCPWHYVLIKFVTKSVFFFFQHAKAHNTEFSFCSSQKDNKQIDSFDQESDNTDFEKSASQRTNVREHYLKERTYSKTNTSTVKDVENLKRTLTTDDDVVVAQDQPLLLHFPAEVTLKIFSYLGPKDLCHCAQVCRLWSQSARDGELWRELYPVRWIFKKDWKFGADSGDMCSCNCDSEVQTLESTTFSR